MTQDQAYSIQTSILSGELTTDQIISHLQEVESIGLDNEMLLGFWRASKNSQIPIDYLGNILDITGTGGDESGTLNVSTLASIICSCEGITVAKHGNRSATSICGSADVLESLGYNLAQNTETVQNQLEKNNFAFVFAPSFCPAFKFPKEARSKFQKPTYFNLLGPLLNPVPTDYLVMGVSQKISSSLPSCFQIVSKLSRQINLKNTWLIQSQSGMDELSLEGESTIIQPFSQLDIDNNNDIGLVPTLRPELEKNFNQKKFYRQVQIYPSSYFQNIGNPDEIFVKTKQEAKQVFVDVINNQATVAQTNIVILNAAAGLTCAKVSKSFRDGVQLASEIIASGRLKTKFQQIIESQN